MTAASARGAPNREADDYSNREVPHARVRYLIVGHVLPQSMTVDNELLHGPPSVVENDAHGYLGDER
jgi:hypothetical protein